MAKPITSKGLRKRIRLEKSRLRREALDPSEHRRRLLSRLQELGAALTPSKERVKEKVHSGESIENPEGSFR